MLFALWVSFCTPIFCERVQYPELLTMEECVAKATVWSILSKGEARPKCELRGLPI